MPPGGLPQGVKLAAKFHQKRGIGCFLVDFWVLPIQIEAVQVVAGHQTQAGGDEPLDGFRAGDNRLVGRIVAIASHGNHQLQAGMLFALETQARKTGIGSGRVVDLAAGIFTGQGKSVDDLGKLASRQISGSYAAGLFCPGRIIGHHPGGLTRGGGR